MMRKPELATRGYVSASVNYTTNTDDHPSNLDKMYTEIKNSVKAVVAQAKQHGYPVNQMAITGKSAGGTLAMTYAFRDGKDSPVPLKFVFRKSAPRASNRRSGLAQMVILKATGETKRSS